MIGEDGNDSLEGGEGNDYFLAGRGADLIVGGAGNDIIAIDDVLQSSQAYGFDRISGFDNPGPTPGDVIDLGFVDPFPSTEQDEAFLFVGMLSSDAKVAEAQQKWGHVWVFDHDWNESTLVQGWTAPGPGESDGSWFQFWIFDGPDVTAADYTADDFVL